MSKNKKITPVTSFGNPTHSWGLCTHRVYAEIASYISRHPDRRWQKTNDLSPDVIPLDIHDSSQKTRREVIDMMKKKYYGEHLSNAVTTSVLADYGIVRFTYIHEGKMITPLWCGYLTLGLDEYKGLTFDPTKYFGKVCEPV